MKAFTYERPATVAAAAKAVAARPGAKFIAGGTNLLDLMKLEVETPTHLVDVNRLPLDKVEADAGGRAADRRAGAQQRSGGRPARPEGLRGAEPRPAGRRLGPAAQQGHHGRQPAAAYALLLFLRHHQALQQARAGSGCSAIGGFNRIHAIVGAERRLHRHPPVRHGGRHAGARRDGRDHDAGRHRPRSIPIAEFHRLAGQHAADRDRSEAGRDDHGRDAAAAAQRACRSTARCATALPTPSRSSRSRPWSRPTAARSARRGWRSAGLPISHGGRPRRRRRSRGTRPGAAAFGKAGDAVRRGRPRLWPQRLQASRWSSARSRPCWRRNPLGLRSVP